MDGVFCEGCKGVEVKFPVRICERCRVDMRHGARRLREILLTLLDPKVSRLLDELAGRPQAYSSPTLRLVRGAARRARAERRALAREVVACDGWMLDAECAS